MDRISISLKSAHYFDNLESISAAYLFGSVAKDRAQPNSDIDVAVLFLNDMDMFDRFEHKLGITSELEDMFSREVDVVDLGSADPFLFTKTFI
jgi:predicted nucleotidyltransferase